MPTYTYVCKKCNYEFERIVPIAKMNEPISDPCPNEDCGTLGEVIKTIQGKFSSPEKDLRPPKALGEYMKRIKDNTKGAANFRTD